MSNTVDSTVARDLAALGENSRRDIPALDTAHALRSPNTGDAYRDDRPGAEARRNALAEERRRELVLMPLTLAHVFAHRLGRIAAGGMAVAVSAVMMLLVFDPLLMRFAAWVVPGLNVGLLITLAALAIIGSYVIASWIGEYWFARRMRIAIATSTDAYEDLEQLAQGPIDIAQRAVRRLDGWSVGLFLAGAASITLVFGYLVIIVGKTHDISHAWSIIGILDTGALQRNLGGLAIAVTTAGVIALVLGRACAREQTLASTVPRALASWTSLVVAGVVGVVVSYNTFHLMFGVHRVGLLSERARLALTLGATVAIVLPLAWGTLFWRRREQARVGVD
jgi:hypothetical protein